MIEQDRQALIEYRLKQAIDSMHQAEILAAAREWSGVVNRAYYSMFYSALALLLTKDLSSSKHSGVLTIIDREFVKTGKLPIELSRQFREAFNERQKADYAEMAVVSPEKAEAMVESARTFIDMVSELLRKGI
jgi:uncharacterized protein (UPF0332 family)